MSPGEAPISAEINAIHEEVIVRNRRGERTYELRGAPGKTFHLRVGPGGDVASRGTGVLV